MARPSMAEWVGGIAGLPADAAATLAASLATHGVSDPAILLHVSPKDWKEITGVIGYRHLLVSAAQRAAPAKAIGEMRAECERKEAGLSQRRAHAAELKSELDRFEASVADLERSIAAQRALIAAARGESARARLHEIEKEVEAARAANRAIKVDIETARFETAQALKAKEDIIGGVVDTQRTSVALKSLSLPSLSPNGPRKSKPKKAPKDKWANLTDAPWYVGAADRETCVARLLLPSVGPGFFAIRDGPSPDNPYQLSFRGFGDGPDSVRHVRITRNAATGKLKLARRKPDSFEATNLGDLVGYYMNMDVGEGITLSEPAPKPKPVIKSKAILPSELGLPTA